MTMEIVEAHKRGERYTLPDVEGTDVDEILDLQVIEEEVVETIEDLEKKRV